MSPFKTRPKPKFIPRPRKATDQKVTQAFLDERVAWATHLGFKKQKWVMFCENMLKKGLEMTLYEARQTVSKYVTVRGPNHKQFKVRFSNHKPIERREALGDCDFFVGHTNFTVTTYLDATYAALKYFGKVS